MWAVFLVAALAVFRRKLSPRAWRMSHMLLVLVIVVGTAVHALKIEGSMEALSKLLLCIVVLMVTAAVWFKLFPRR